MFDKDNFFKLKTRTNKDGVATYMESIAVKGSLRSCEIPLYVKVKTQIISICSEH